MKKLRKVLAILFAAVLCLPILSGCHGRQEQAAFTVSEEFDTSRDYEITFWAKNDTNKIQYFHQHDAQRLHHLSGPHRHLSHRRQRRGSSR